MAVQCSRLHRVGHARLDKRLDLGEGLDKDINDLCVFCGMDLPAKSTVKTLLLDERVNRGHVDTVAPLEPVTLALVLRVDTDERVETADLDDGLDAAFDVLVVDELHEGLTAGTVANKNDVFGVIESEVRIYQAE